MESLLVGLGVVVAVPIFIMYLAQDSLIFMPQPMPEAQRAALVQRSPAAQSIFIEADDGTRLHAWHLKGPPDSPLVMYFGGNAEGVSWMMSQAALRAPQASWLLVDYRGYGASEGSPSEAALVADAIRWHDHLSKSSRQIYLFGRSLGSGVAVQLAAVRPAAGVILVTPFDSLVEVGKRHYPILPIGWLLRHRFESAAAAPKIAAPLLCIVAARDEVIPASHAQRLYDAWGGAKRWVSLEGAGHNSTDGHPDY